MEGTDAFVHALSILPKLLLTFPSWGCGGHDVFCGSIDCNSAHRQRVMWTASQNPMMVVWAPSHITSLHRGTGGPTFELSPCAAAGQGRGLFRRVDLCRELLLGTDRSPVLLSLRAALPEHSLGKSLLEGSGGRGDTEIISVAISEANPPLQEQS